MTTIEDQFAQLKSHPRYRRATMTPTIEFRSEGPGNLVTLPSVPLPSGWTHDEVDVHFWVPQGFPCARPRGFWTTEDLRITYEEEQTLFSSMRWVNGGRWPQWTRIGKDYQPPGHEHLMKWLCEPRMWSACSDTLLTYAHFVRQRLYRIE